MEQKHRTEQAGIDSEYVIPANSGRMVKESSITSMFKALKYMISTSASNEPKSC